MACCDSCSHGGPCAGEVSPAYAAQAMRAHDQTAPRFAQTEVGYDAQNPDAYLWRRQLGGLGDLGAPPTPAECLAQGMVLDLQTGACVSPFAPGGEIPGGQIPGGQMPGAGLVVTEQQCAAREAEARRAGASEEAGKMWKAAAVSAVVSLAAGYAFAKLVK